MRLHRTFIKIDSSLRVCNNFKKYSVHVSGNIFPHVMFASPSMLDFIHPFSRFILSPSPLISPVNNFCCFCSQ